MPDVTIQIKGLREQLLKFATFGPIGKKWATKAIDKSIFDIERATKPITPIDTGRLRSGFRTNVKTMRGELKNITPYALYVHEGTSRWPVTQPPRNPYTVRRFMVEGVERSSFLVNRNFQEAGDAMVKELAVKVI